MMRVDLHDARGARMGWVEVVCTSQRPHPPVMEHVYLYRYVINDGRGNTSFGEDVPHRYRDGSQVLLQRVLERHFGPLPELEPTKLPFVSSDTTGRESGAQWL